MIAHYNSWIVALSYLVAVMASYVALDMAARVSATRGGPYAKYWLIGGACAMGIGIWSMHFVGMLAFSLPIPVPYSVPVTFLSMLFAIGASGIALHTISRGSLTLVRLLVAGLIMGSGVALMHYTGMAALQVYPAPTYHHGLFLLSIAIAVAASIAAMWISFQLKSDTILTAFWKKSASALVMGVAIWGMHFTAMAAAVFAPDTYCLGDSASIDHKWLAAAVGFCSLTFFATMLTVSILDARLARRGQALEAESDRFFNQSLDLLGSAGFDGYFRRLNPAWETVLGIPRATLLAQPFIEAAHPADRGVIANAVRDLARGGVISGVECRLRCADGSYRAFAWSATPLENGSGFYATGHDITDRKRSDAELRESEKRFRSLLESAPEAMMVVGERGGIELVNAQAEKTFGYGRHELMGRSIDLLFPDAAFGSMGQAMPLTGRRKDGSEFPVEISLAPIDVGGARGIAAAVRDITQRRLAEQELKRANERLIEASRMAGMAEVATNVLHNVGNVLNSVNVSCSVVIDAIKTCRASDLERVVALLQSRRDDLAAFFEHSQGRALVPYLEQLAGSLRADRQATIQELEHLRENIDHIKQIVTMQQDAAKLSGIVEVVKVAELVNDSLRLNSAALVRDQIEVVRDFEAVPEISVQKHKLLQILINLSRNAIFACVEGRSAGRQVVVQIRQRGDHVQLVVADNGIGIAPENLARIFNHGFTTRKDGHGFGLHSGALAAREMGGSLKATSAGTGLGASFRLDLPMMRDTRMPEIHGIATDKNYP